MRGLPLTKQPVKNAKLKILLICEIFQVLSSFLCSREAFDFLSCHPDSYNLKSSWITIFVQLQLSNIRIESFSGSVSSAIPRAFVFHVVRNLGYNCTRCWIPLTGPQGLFACTNLCTTCSIKTFKESGSTSYVDGKIRFYLSGEKSMITKGRAFLTHPYWISDDDKYYADFFNENGCDSYQLAEEIYAEKNFFNLFCTSQMDISRPRDDKAATLGKMLDYHRGRIADEKEEEIGDDGQESQQHEHGHYFELQDSETESDQSNTTASDYEGTTDTAASSSKTNGTSETTSCTLSAPSSKDNRQKSVRNSKRQPEWVKSMPPTLLGLYEVQKSRRISDDVTSPLGTSPLRELVVQMHNREGAVIKQLE